MPSMQEYDAQAKRADILSGVLTGIVAVFFFLGHPIVGVVSMLLFGAAWVVHHPKVFLRECEMVRSATVRLLSIGRARFPLPQPRLTILLRQKTEWKFFLKRTSPLRG